jgi:hypothetical protein
VNLGDTKEVLWETGGEDVVVSVNQIMSHQRKCYRFKHIWGASSKHEQVLIQLGLVRADSKWNRHALLNTNSKPLQINTGKVPHLLANFKLAIVFPPEA